MLVSHHTNPRAGNIEACNTSPANCGDPKQHHHRGRPLTDNKRLDKYSSSVIFGLILRSIILRFLSLEPISYFIATFRGRVLLRTVRVCSDRKIHSDTKCFSSCPISSPVLSRKLASYDIRSRPVYVKCFPASSGRPLFCIFSDYLGTPALVELTTSIVEEVVQVFT